jgi:hypothetical protein
MQIEFHALKTEFETAYNAPELVVPVKKLYKLPVRSKVKTCREFSQCRARTVEHVRKQSYTPCTIGLCCAKVASLNRNEMKHRR